MARNVILRSPSGTICRIRPDSRLQQFAMRWSYVVRQRGRWARSRSARRRQSARLQSELAELGVSAAHLRRLARAGVVEVSIPYSEEEQGWECRILPWEHVLTAATHPHRGSESLVVIRHLSRRGSTRLRQPKTLTVIQAAPGALDGRYDFSAETSLVRSSLSTLDYTSIGSPDEKLLREKLTDKPPDVIHLTGIDIHQGRSLLGLESSELRDGFFLQGTGTLKLEEVGAKRAARLLNSGSPRPQFIGFNVWNSGARLAALSVAEGANASLGFQHTFDDAVAEIFFVNFYRACLENQWNYLAAFMNAWNSISGYRQRIRGSSIVLWSARSLVEGAADLDPRGRSKSEPDEAQEPETPVIRLADPQQEQIRDFVQVTVVPKPQLNYSLLHNGSSVLDELRFRFVPETTASEQVHAVRDIDVTVALHVGSDTFPYRTKVTVGQDVRLLDLANPETVADEHGNPDGGVKLPLTSLLVRTASERIQTSLFVEAKWHDQVLYRHTHPVWLAPVDQWSLADDEIQWLPSFVQPRDPAVAETIASAQKYLRCIADYGAAGFDGYQSFDGDARGKKKWDGIDRQVRAIWAALVFDYQLAYINPPPSYAESTQRLRTPGEVIAQGRGTCVDLAILLASCLEWVEIYPVVFMLDDHAFPGYWRSLDAYYKFVDVAADNLGGGSDEERGSREEPSPGWISDRSTYAEIRSYVHKGTLVPLETVMLTSGGGFQETIDEGRTYFENKRNRGFHSMVDILRARECVTPLPLNR